MFGDSLHEALSANALLGALSNCLEWVKTELEFDLDTALGASLKLKKTPKLDFHAALMAARSERDNRGALTVYDKKIFILHFHRAVAQIYKQQLSVYINFCIKRLEHTSLDDWKHVASSDTRYTPVPALCSRRISSRVAG